MAPKVYRVTEVTLHRVGSKSVEVSTEIRNTVWFQNVEYGKPVFKKRKIQHELNIRQRNHVKATISKSGNESITRSNCF